MEPKTFIFTGRSGCGKGTQTNLLIDMYARRGEPSYRIESGATLRSFIEGEGYTNRLARSVIDKGGLMPEFISIWVWSNLLIRDFQSPTEHLVLDGMPRRYHEAPVLDTALDFYGRKERYVVFINVSRAWSEKRLRARMRKDDTDADIEARLNWYETDVVPVIEYFRKNPRYAFVEVNGEQAIEQVHRDIVAAIETHAGTKR